jgi:hypothetical protein
MLGKHHFNFLGEQQLGSERIASYYTPGDRASGQYFMVGVAAGAGCVIVIIEIDVQRDSKLRPRTERRIDFTRREAPRGPYEADDAGYARPEERRTRTLRGVPAAARYSKD